MTTAMDKLTEAIGRLRAPVCVGLDPSVDLVPDALLGRHGDDVPGAFAEFNKGIIDAVCDIVPVVKPQIAMYERYGPAGLAAYFSTVEYARSRGLLVIGDVKRGDIGSTAAAYADAHLAPGGADIITVNPYLGGDSIETFTDMCKKAGKGIFVLLVTSNPGGKDIQQLELAGGDMLYQRVGGLVSKWGEGLIGMSGYSSVGAVVGATFPDQAKDLREHMPHTFFLVPGYGAQGGTGADAAKCFDKNGNGAVVNSSRGIIAAWKKPEHAGKPYAECARAETVKMIDDLRGHIYGR